MNGIQVRTKKEKVTVRTHVARKLHVIVWQRIPKKRAKT